MKLLGRAQDPEFWSKTVREGKEYKTYVDNLHKYWNENNLDNAVFEAISYSKFKLFWTTGDRAIYEKIYFDRRKAMESAVPLALIYPEEEKYITLVMDLIYIICDEYTWCLPAHHGKLEVNNKWVIDLFAAESACNLAYTYTLLGDRLEPLIIERIKYEIDERVIKPFLAVDNYGWWEKGTNNWTAVCVGAVGCSVMLMHPELVGEAFIKRMEKALDGYLSGFKPDGVCLEGCGYWGYGVSFYLQYIDMLRIFTEGRVNYFDNPKLRVIATFPQKMFLTGKCAVSFADSGRTLSYLTGTVHRLKTEYPDDVLIYSPEYAEYSGGCGRLPVKIHCASWLEPEFYNSPSDDTVEREYYMPDSQWYVRRTSAYGFAAKAGNNDEMHNHNDVGSFIFAKGGRQLLMDLGSGRYTRQYFASETRYSVLECAARGHSLPLIDGKEQRAGRQYAAADVHFADGSFSMDIAGAYGIEELTRLRRSFTTASDTVTLTDEYEYSGSGSLVERLVTTVEPKVADGRIEVGDAVVLYDPSLASVSVSTEQGNASQNACVYLIDLTLAHGVNKITLIMK